MKKRLPLIVILFLVLIILLGSGVLYFSTLSSHLNNPIFGSSASQNLAAALSNSTLHLDENPVVRGDDLIASISGRSVIFSRKKDLISQVRALQLVVSQFKIDNKTAREIDLRFNKVVVRY